MTHKNPSGSDRLVSWKRIAVYLSRSERTARRWEHEEGLPVRRHHHGYGASVYAIRSDIDAWLRSRNSKPAAKIDQSAEAAFARGEFLLGQQNAPALMKAVEEFKTACKVRPDYTQAYARMAEALQLAAILGGAPPSQTMPAALEALARALALDPMRAESHTSMGLILTSYSYDWQGAEAAFDKALSLDPNFASAYQWRAELFVVLGRFDEAFADLARAEALGPASLAVAASRGYALVMARRNFEAIEAMDDLLSRDRNYPLAYVHKGLALAHEGDFAKAAEVLSEGVDRSGGYPDLVAICAYARARAGDVQRAKEALDTLKAMFGDTAKGAFQIGIATLGFGKFEDAVANLERSFEARPWHLTLLGQEAMFDDLRANDDFNALLNRLGLQQSAFKPNVAKSN